MANMIKFCGISLALGGLYFAQPSQISILWGGSCIFLGCVIALLSTYLRKALPISEDIATKLPWIGYGLMTAKLPIMLLILLLSSLKIPRIRGKDDIFYQMGFWIFILMFMLFGIWHPIVSSEAAYYLLSTLLGFSLLSTFYFSYNYWHQKSRPSS